MKNFKNVIFLLIFTPHLQASMLVRVPVEEEKRILETIPYLEITQREKGKWVEVIVPEGKNLPKGEIISPDIEGEFLKVKDIYPTYNKLKDSLFYLESQFPGIMEICTVGVSWEDRPILGVKIGNKTTQPKAKILVDGLTHAREWPTLSLLLFFIDTLVTSYTTDETIKNIIDSLELTIIPCLNPDGYIFSHDDPTGDPLWRKNRHYFVEDNVYGVDLNRNYYPAEGTAEGGWGNVGWTYTSFRKDEASFCGENPFSEKEVKVIQKLIEEEEFVLYISYHSYGEMVVYPWGFTTRLTEDDSIYKTIGYEVAQLIERIEGGSYFLLSGDDLYFISGEAADWAYSHSLYIKGKPILAYLIEIGNMFAPPEESVFVKISRENFEGFIYFCKLSSTLKLTPKILPPTIEKIDSTSGNYEIKWEEMGADEYKLEEFMQMEKLKDGAEEENELWIMKGFRREKGEGSSGEYFYITDEECSLTTFMKTKFPIVGEEKVEFFCKYELDSTLNYVFVEISKHGRKWEIVKKYTGRKDKWEKESIDLPNWSSLYLRFRNSRECNLDTNYFCIDEIYPVTNFKKSHIISGITETKYQFENKPPGWYWYRVCGKNERGWGDWSMIEDVKVVKYGVAEKEKRGVELKLTTKGEGVKIIYSKILHPTILKVFDLTGRKVDEFSIFSSGEVIWSPPVGGVYFFHIEKKKKKFVIIKTSSVK